MKKSRHNSGTSLFLMEMILTLLFLSLSSAACIQIFAAARKSRLQAEQWNQIQALTTSVGEAFFLSDLRGLIAENACNSAEKEVIWTRQKEVQKHENYY